MDSGANPIDPSQLTRVAAEACRWLSSPEGQQEISKAIAAAEQKAEALREARVVAPNLMHEPVTR